jgi:hypothetical protein
VRAFIASVFVLTVVAAPPADAAPSDHANWKQFRSEHPYHVQGVALSAAAADGRTLIIAEPPPWTTLRALQEGWPREFNGAVLEKQRVGVNGWVADVVTHVPPQDAATEELVAQLSGFLFKTAYKSYALPIAAAPRRPGVDLDVSVSTGQLARWFGLVPPEHGRAWLVIALLLRVAMFVAVIGILRTRRQKWLIGGALIVMSYADRPPAPDVRFVRRHATARSETLAELLKAGGGVYDSERRGLVLFALPKSASLDGYRAALREFALDTDAILGAVGTDRATAIVARERIVPVDVMPPLRVETLLQLASVKSSELAQSYERRNLFAGRFDSGRHQDWAPIYLSDELKETEYGSLLNITDQLLKSWSQHGEIRYANFNYADPPTFPFPVRLTTHAKATRVTFNWNTKGVGYSDEIGGFKLLGFARTGALPVDYLGEQDSRLGTAEDVAYEYFATTRDPNLARVVQYAGAYQIFRAFEIGATNPYPIAKDTLDRAPLERLAALLLEALRRSQHEPQWFTRFGRSPRDRELAGQFQVLIARLEAFHAHYGDKGDADLASAAIEPRAWSRRADRSPRSYDVEVAEITADLMSMPLVGAFLDEDIRRGVLDRYLAAATAHTGWIHTPSVVVSWPTGDDAARVTGGHNLSSTITHYAVDDTLAAGNVRVVEAQGSRTIFYTTRDEARIHQTVRQAGRARAGRPMELERAVQQQLQRTEAHFGSVSRVLKAGDLTIAERGLGTSTGVRVTPSTWTYRDGIDAAHAAKLKTLERPHSLSVVVERSREQGGILLSVGGEHSTIYAPDTASAVDAFVTRVPSGSTGSRYIDVTFANFEPEQARGFLRNVELHEPGVLRGRVNAAVTDGERGVAAAADVRRGEWNVAAATFETRTLNAAGDVRHVLEIPAVSSVRRPLRLIVEATAEAASRIQAALLDFMTVVRAVRSTDELLVALHDFLNQIRSIPGVKKVDPIQVHEARDLLFVWSGECGGSGARL